MRLPLMLDLNDVVQHPGRRVEFPLQIWLDREEVPPQAEPIDGTLCVESGGRLIHLEGDFHVDVWLECARCMARFREPVEFHVEEDYSIVGTPSGVSSRSYAEVDDQEPYPLFEGNKLLIEELLRQYLLLQLPMQPLCRTDCKGLCSHCGQNLNEGQCGCSEETSHPAFAKLAQLWYAEEAEK
jgi:uncharacterized protein